MWLLIGLPDSTAPDWEGFHFLVNRQVSGTRASLEACTGGWNWTPMETIRYRVEGNQFHLSIPRAFLGIQGQSLTVEFKWIDNTQQPGNILDTYLHGDTAPEGRFRYRYEAGSRSTLAPSDS